ncbi:MAG: 2-amino-4-hydroxy-6-hydroxymethyldihydropteridine diphosphokinase [Nitrospiria bacterium]
MMVIAFVGLGSNLGDRELTIQKAIEEIGGLKSTKLLDRSSLYETDPVAETPQPSFLNGVIQVQSELTAKELLQALLRIEKKYGRVRGGFEMPRTLDLDLLFYAGQIIQDHGLNIPHPRLHLRKFVLFPLAEIAPHWEHPVFKKTVQELLEQNSSPAQAKIYSSRFDQTRAVK